MDPDLRADLESNRPVKIRPLAKALNRSPNAIYLAIRRREIAVSRIGASLRVPAQEAARLLGITPEPNPSVAKAA